MVYIIASIFFLLALYTVIPYGLSRGLGWKVMKRVESPTDIAFTFDDGPDPTYTPVLLDVLKENGVKATFFVVGSKAEKNPDIIRRMHMEGHLLGIHNYEHTSNWLMSPWKVKKGIEKTAAIIEEITGERTVYYRPPWGILNLIDFIKKSRYFIILWSISAEDWKTSGGSDKIRRALSGIKGGDVVLLHDCGDTPGADIEAPAITIEALKDVLPAVKAKGYTCVRVDEMR